jgi:hypothetical protein
MPHNARAQRPGPGYLAGQAGTQTFIFLTFYFSFVTNTARLAGQNVEARAGRCAVVMWRFSYFFSSLLNRKHPF